jgi:hypothetical protein
VCILLVDVPLLCSFEIVCNLKPLLNFGVCVLYLSYAGTYIDKKCPFTGTVSIRGRIIAGTCHSAKMNRTIIVRRNYLHFVKKYQRHAIFC